MDEQIASLCRLHGISSDYYDAWGHRREVPPEVCKALLAALGVAPDGSATSGAKAAGGPSEWLERVYVLPCSDPEPCIMIKPGAPMEQTLRWKYQGTGRDVTEGTWFFASAPGESTTAWRLPFSVAPGPHSLTFTAEDGSTSVTWIIGTPDTGYRPPELRDGRRAWGIAIQLYALRSDRNWGIGDFTDLAQVVEYASSLGASLVGVNPLHAPFLHDPDHASPYSPSTRLFLNPLYIDVEAVPEFQHSERAHRYVANPDFQSQIHALRAAPLVDYRATWSHKKAVLEMLHDEFRETADDDRRRAFSEFRNRHGEALAKYSLYEALQEYFFEHDRSMWGWPRWPEDYRCPESPAVIQFAATHNIRVEFFAYLQWLTESQLDSVSDKARQRLGIGLYRDFAVGVDRGGAETWADQSLFVFSVNIGCPPDPLNQNGQDWGLPPVNPRALVARGFEPYTAAWSANMRGAGALRIDHVMGLSRLFWLPGNGGAGAYVHYPMDPLFRLLAHESERERCLIVGEDLGTVPPEIRGALSDFGFLSYRVLYFEHDAQGVFAPPGSLPRDALVAVTTHDLPTFAGFWLQNDLNERRTLGLFPSQAFADQQEHERARDKQGLIDALVREGLWPKEDPVPETPSIELMLAVHAYLARSPACLLLVQMEDLFLMPEAVNLPGTQSERHNWRRKLTLPVAALDPDVAARLSTIMLVSGRGSGRARSSPK